MAQCLPRAQFGVFLSAFLWSTAVPLNFALEPIIFFIFSFLLGGGGAIRMVGKLNFSFSNLQQLESLSKFGFSP